MANTMEDLGPTDAELVNRILKKYHFGKISRRVFFKRMAALGYQNAEALELAESWDNDI